jgi:hypothetical protein
MLALLLLAGVSCASSDSTLSPSDQQESPSFDLAGDLLGGVTNSVVGTLGTATDLLLCSAQPYLSVTKTIGPEGGTIKIGKHELVIPNGALKAKTRITAEQMPGSTNSLRFSPEGLHFERPALLTMDYDNCVVRLLKKHIVYTDESLRILELLTQSKDYPKYDYVTSPIDHFSRYAVAY